VIATVTDLVIAAPLAFAFGLIVGLFLSSFYRIVKRNGPR
jgi:hypothetical protein